MAKPDEKKEDKAKSHTPSLEEKLLNFQANLVSLYRQKQYETKASGKRPDGNKLESKFTFEDLKAKLFDDKITIPEGEAGLDDVTKLELQRDEFKDQKKTYDDEKKNIEAAFKIQIEKIQNAYKPQVERLIETNDHKNFREVHASEWTKAAKGTEDTKNAHEDTLKSIQTAKTNLIKAKAEEDKKAAAAPDSKPKDLEKGSELRQKLLNNQLQKLDELKTKIENTISKLPEDILEGIRNTKLVTPVSDPSDPQPDPAQKKNLTQGTVEEMNKALVNAQLRKLTGDECVWASADPRKEASKGNSLNASEISDAKPGVYRVRSRFPTTGDIFMCLTGIGAIYLLLSRSTFCITKEGTIGWSTKDNFSPDFFTAFQAKNPGKPMYLTFNATMTEEYFKEMVKEARTRRPILIMALSEKCKTALGEEKTRAFEALLARDVGLGDPNAIGSIAVGDNEESKLHVRTRSS